MARRFAKHNRFSEALDTHPSRLEEFTVDRRLLERQRNRSGWLRNLGALAALIVVGVIVMVLVFAG